VRRQSLDNYTASFLRQTSRPIVTPLDRPRTAARHRGTTRRAGIGSRVHLHRCLARRSTAFSAVCSREYASGHAAKTVNLVAEVTCLASESIANKSTRTRPQACNPPNTICHKVPAMATRCNTRLSHPMKMSLSRLRAMLAT
jgi:hypothetical protein